MGLALKDGNDVFITGDSEDGTHPWGPDRNPMFMPGGTFPLGWTRTYGSGKGFGIPLGHGGVSFKSASVTELVLNAVVSGNR